MIVWYAIGVKCRNSMCGRKIMRYNSLCIPENLTEILVGCKECQYESMRVQLICDDGSKRRYDRLNISIGTLHVQMKVIG